MSPTNPPPRKRFGQHFLIDQGVLQRIAAASLLGSPSHVIEIGPGPGALTELLLAGTKKLSVIELDRDLAAALPQQFPQSHLHVHQMDILNCELASLATEDEPKPPVFRVVGNLPYNISTPLIFHLLDQLPHIDQMVFMVQKEVANRLAAQPGNKLYGRLSVMTSLWLEAACLFDVPPTAFDPPPKVDSTVIRLQPRQQPIADMQETDFDLQLTGKLVTAAFAQRRKTLRNALKGLADSSQLEQAGIDPGSRAETIAPQRYVSLGLIVARSTATPIADVN